ncbi:hypothetical protein M408DRAFT_8074 [Serendipita vermifera MAFF 305830]|uniref:Uncharacterized protein n=1 Tax=Serendipita vermifera MAFF 305830 TaxID=933852 RepID=A0A0C3AZB4_SERVB|nr:hypothetical protein M408DRAFT_8074 [Serendipita vermifera MAFF 305830]
MKTVQSMGKAHSRRSKSRWGHLSEEYVSDDWLETELESTSYPLRTSSPNPEVTSLVDPNTPWFPELLIMHYGDETALTRCDEKYEDVESSARQSFPIAENVPLFIAAKIVSSGTNRIRIDPCVWENVSKDISEIWITTRNDLPRGRVVTLNSYRFTLDKWHSDHASSSFRIRVDNGAKVLDIKQALKRKYLPHAESFEIQIFDSLKDDDPVTMNQYKLKDCTTCREGRGYYGDGVPRHFCLSRMEYYAKEPTPDPPRYPTPITRNLPRPKPEPSGFWCCCCFCPDD